MRGLWFCALVLAGCLTQTPPVTPEALDADFQPTHDLSFTLADLPLEGGLVLEVVPQAPVSVRLDGRFQSREGVSAGPQEVQAATPDPCMSYFTWSARGWMIGGLRAPAVGTAVGPADLSFQAGAGSVTYLLERDLELLPSDGPVPLMVGVHAPHAWSPASEFVIELSSEQEFHWRLREPTRVECHTVASRMDGATALDVGSAAAVTGAQEAFTSQGRTQVGVYVGADIEFRGELRGGEDFRSTFAHTGDVGFDYYIGSGFLPAGEYVLEVNRLAGSNTPFGDRTLAALVLHEVPEWAIAPS